MTDLRTQADTSVRCPPFFDKLHCATVSLDQSATWWWSGRRPATSAWSSRAQSSGRADTRSLQRQLCRMRCETIRDEAGNGEDSSLLWMYVALRRNKLDRSAGSMLQKEVGRKPPVVKAEQPVKMCYMATLEVHRCLPVKVSTTLYPASFRRESASGERPGLACLLRTRSDDILMGFGRHPLIDQASYLVCPPGHPDEGAGNTVVGARCGYVPAT
jgi:hypothetical protein